MGKIRAAAIAIVSVATMSRATFGQSVSAPKMPTVSFEVAPVRVNETGGARGPVRMKPECNGDERYLNYS